MHPLDRVNALLALLVLALGLWLWLDRPPPAAPPLTALDPAAVQQVRLYQGQTLLWAARRAGAGWALSHPQAAPADGARLEQLLGVLRTPSLTRFAAPAELTPYGLAAPAYRLVCDGTELDFGGLEPTTGLRYLLVAGQVHLIGDGFHHHLLAGAAGFAAPRD